jgi:hypothetical protein
MSVIGGHGQRWGLSFSQYKRVYKRFPRGKSFLGINSNPLSLILLSNGSTFYFLVECMRTQSLNVCKRVGLKVTFHSYWEHGVEVKSTLGRVRIQLVWGKRKFVWPKREYLAFTFLHEQ